MGDKKMLLGEYPSYQKKIKITKVNFMMNFVGAPPQDPKKQSSSCACRIKDKIN
jgi:hypothetical protein